MWRSQGGAALFLMGLSHPLGDQDNLRRINLKPKGKKKTTQIGSCFYLRIQRFSTQFHRLWNQYKYFYLRFKKDEARELLLCYVDVSTERGKKTSGEWNYEKLKETKGTNDNSAPQSSAWTWYLPSANVRVRSKTTATLIEKVVTSLSSWQQQTPADGPQAGLGWNKLYGVGHGWFQ